jgi:DNA replication and repair protein RecF
MLTHLKLRDFRCFETLEFEAVPGAQFFIGDNAQGKTSILEAVCVLLRLASPRSSVLGPLVRLGAREFSVQGRCDQRQLQVRFGPEGRKLSLDGEEQSGAAEYLRVARLVYFANTDLELVRGPAGGRRRFLDFLGSQLEPLYRANLLAYEKALRSRNRLLKAASIRWREVEAYDQPLLQAGDLLSDLRRSLVAELSPWATRAQRDIGEGSSFSSEEALSLEYQSGSGENFAAALAASREEERRLRQTVAGPHRDDLILRLGGQPAGVFGSEGQQRTLALALKLAQAGLLESTSKTAPLLLLDDIFGELDPYRRNALLAALPARSQQLVATTHLDWLDRLPARSIWRLSGRRLELCGGG